MNISEEKGKICINDTISVNPFGCGNRHVGIVSSISNDTVRCNEWYGITDSNLVKNSAFSKSVVQKVPIHVFNTARKTWKQKDDSPGIEIFEKEEKVRIEALEDYTLSEVRNNKMRI